MRFTSTWMQCLFSDCTARTLDVHNITLSVVFVLSNCVLLQVSNQDLIGGILHTDTSFSVWWCVSRGTARPCRCAADIRNEKQASSYMKIVADLTELCRKLRRSKRFRASSQDSERCVHLLRRHGSWQGQAEPRRITVFINPVSGQGRCATQHCHFVKFDWLHASLHS